jgi:uncharacterized repeat protein (TIGR01451 family)
VGNIRILMLIATLLFPGAAMASQSVSLSSEVFLEKAISDGNGQVKIVLYEPKIVTPGDKLIFFLKYHNVGAAPAANFVVTNPLPGAIAYQGSNDAAAELSVDNGRNWGFLATLKIHEVNGVWRAARMEDVTHVRWTMRSPIPAGGQGKLSFRGIVR